jgi:hypothetical protein
LKNLKAKLKAKYLFQKYKSEITRFRFFFSTIYLFNKYLLKFKNFKLFTNDIISFALTIN